MNWSDFDLVVDIETAARILKRSVRDINRDLAAGSMVPEPIPVISGPRKHLRRQWSRDALEAYLKGGYLRFKQQAAVLHQAAKTGTTSKQKPRRHYFGAASARMVAR